MSHWIEYGIVYLCSHGSYWCCIGLVVTVFICVLMGLPYVAFDWLWHCLMVLLMLHLIDCDIVYLCFYGSFLCCIGLNVTLFICILMVLPHVTLDSLLHCLSLFLWFFLMLHWIDCDIVFLVFLWFYLMLHSIDCGVIYLCSHGSSACCIGLNVTLLTYVLMVLPFVALHRLWHCLSVF